MILVALLACSDPPPPFQPTVDPEWTVAAVDALCKVVEGAGKECTRDGDTARFEGASLTLRVTVDQESESFGVMTLKGHADLSVDGKATPALRTPVRAFGGNKGEAHERAAHEWAVVYGVALADWAMADAARPALVAVDKGNHESPPAKLGGGTLYRGWPLVRGSRQPLDHDPVLAALSPVLAGWTSGTHAIVLEVSAEMDGNMQRTLWLDGAESPAVEAAVASTRFAGAPGLQLRQFYLWSD
ncbi:MAG: hypothetical protein ACI8PZ_003002 [Myxococcota bacterium]